MKKKQKVLLARKLRETSQRDTAAAPGFFSLAPYQLACCFITKQNVISECSERFPSAAAASSRSAGHGGGLTCCVRRLMWLELAYCRTDCLSASFCRAEMKTCWLDGADRELSSLKVPVELDLSLSEALLRMTGRAANSSVKSKTFFFFISGLLKVQC